MQQAKNGDIVKVHYNGRLTDGTPFDSSSGREPLQFEVGSGMVISGFDNGVTGMSVGQKKTITIPADDAYGPKDPNKIIDFPKSEFPDDLKPEVGMRLNLTDNEGQVIPVEIVDVGDDTVKLDGNHPLTGETLIFDIELVEIGGGSRIIMP